MADERQRNAAASQRPQSGKSDDVDVIPMSGVSPVWYAVGAVVLLLAIGGLVFGMSAGTSKKKQKQKELLELTLKAEVKLKAAADASAAASAREAEAKKAEDEGKKKPGGGGPAPGMTKGDTKKAAGDLDSLGKDANDALK
eukprot:TRINITY_DN36149_c0_g1_i1.p3 TRINITY_DN36149_c0_g1~~TRINITY_DN36149_c0_g1_i1.p3  ORF type:complete len:141 (-),score=12.41 TRINITY_DN36149_c0_g1_i1:179-601(-)